MIEFKNQYITGQYALSNEIYSQNSNKMNFNLVINNNLNCLSLNHNIPYDKLFNNSIDLKHIEPEKHLDELSQAVSKVINPLTPKKFVATTYKDNTLLKRFEKLFLTSGKKFEFKYAKNNVEKTLLNLKLENYDYLTDSDLLI